MNAAGLICLQKYGRTWGTQLLRRSDERRSASDNSQPLSGLTGQSEKQTCQTCRRFARILMRALCFKLVWRPLLCCRKPPCPGERLVGPISKLKRVRDRAR